MSNIWSKSRHQPLNAQQAYLLRRQKREQQQGISGHPIRVSQIADHDQLYFHARMLQGRTPHARGSALIHGHDLSPSELGGLARGYSERIMAGQYRPEPTHVVTIPKPGQRERRVLRIPPFFDRVIGRAVHQAFERFLENRYRRVSYGFRKKRSLFRLLADMEVAMRRTGQRLVVSADIRRAFDHVPLPKLIELFQQMINRVRQPKFGNVEKQATQQLLDVMIQGHDATRPVGIDQGAVFSPAALNVILTVCHDQPMVEWLAQHHPATGVYRYADNLCYLAGTQEVANNIIQHLTELLRREGFSLKPDWQSLDVTQPNAGALFGFQVGWQDHLLKLSLDTDAFTALEQRLQEAVAMASHPAKAARDMLTGWLSHFGCAFRNDSMDQVITILKRLGAYEVDFNHLNQLIQASCQRWQHERQQASKRPNPLKKPHRPPPTPGATDS